MKWLIQVFGADPAQDAPDPGALADMIQQMKDIDVDLRATGELVVEQGLDHPLNALVVSDGVSRGSHADPPHSIQGFWIVDVHDQDRAIAIARRISAIAFGAPVEIRLCFDAPPASD